MSRNFEDFDEKNIEIAKMLINDSEKITICLLYTSPSPRD